MPDSIAAPPVSASTVPADAMSAPPASRVALAAVRVARVRYTRGTSTSWPSTVSRTYHTKSRVARANCSAVGAWPTRSPSSAAASGAASISDCTSARPRTALRYSWPPMARAICSRISRVSK
ncbi:Uncharacterised protein [Bordetella pertussis]|nr:Uncharacterised protein [Bordetella pertussis]